jgi:hypothetical protein
MAIISTTVEQTRFLAAIDRFSSIAQSKRFVLKSRRRNRGREMNLCEIRKVFLNTDLRFSEVEKLDSHSQLDFLDEIDPVLEGTGNDDQVIYIMESSAFAAPE